VKHRVWICSFWMFSVSVHPSRITMCDKRFNICWKLCYPSPTPMSYTHDNTFSNLGHWCRKSKLALKKKKTQWTNDTRLQNFYAFKCFIPILYANALTNELHLIHHCQQHYIWWKPREKLIRTGPLYLIMTLVSNKWQNLWRTLTFFFRTAGDSEIFWTICCQNSQMPITYKT
jgi:hypothetical protein